MKCLGERTIQRVVGTSEFLDQIIFAVTQRLKDCKTDVNLTIDRLGEEAQVAELQRATDDQDDL